MEILYDLLKAIHVVSFVFMSVPLFNLIVVSERGRFGPDINLPVDTFMENILSGGAPRCFAFQSTVGISGILLLILGPIGIEAIWTDWIIGSKTLLLFVLIFLLTRVHLKIQPEIDALFAKIKEGEPVSEEIISGLKPRRALRKKLASICLFLVLTIIILGLQVNMVFAPVLNLLLIVLAALFARRAYSKGTPLGWF